MGIEVGMVKRDCGVHFWRNLWKTFKIEDLDVEKGQMLRPHSGLEPSKLLFSPSENKFKGMQCVSRGKV